MAELKNLIVNGVARVNGDAYVSDMIYGTASHAISASWAPMPSFTDTDRYVATASFASTGSNGANGVKMTLTRQGSDTGTVVATIPVASTTAAGVMTGAQVTNLNGAVASGSLAKNVTAITASLIASGALAKTAIQPAATASWKAASDWITANSASTHTHSNKAVLDGITAADTASWDAKQAAISDLATIRNNAASGSVAFGWGNHASAGYVKSSGVTSYTLTTSSDYVTVDNAAAVTSTGTRKIDLATKSKNAINWVIANSGSAATAITNNHTHSNKAVLDGISAADTASWDGKWTYNEATIKAVKVNSASRADSAASATTATKLVGTSGSTSIPVYINAGVPTVCAGTVVSTSDRNTWTTASNRAHAADDGLTTPLYGNQGEQTNVVYRGAFKIIDASGGHVEIDIDDSEVPAPSDPETAYGAGVSNKLSIWGGLILNVASTVEFVTNTGASFIWSENSVDVETGGTYEFNCIQYENGGDVYGIITKYSES